MSVLDFHSLDRMTRSNPFVTRLVVIPEIGSTQDEARRLAEAGTEPGTVVLAHQQTVGRGSRGRSWYSPADHGLYLSVILDPAGNPARQPRWTLAAALAVCRTFRSCGVPAEIKWPNDILIRGRKAAGILAEYRSTGRRPTLILGIGANIFQTADDFPPELAGSSTSLALEGGQLEGREQMAAAILSRLSSIAVLMYHGDWAQVREDWSELASGIEGQPVWLSEQDGTGSGLSGVTAGVDESGGLIVRLEDGSRRVLYSSESLERLED